MGTGSGWRGVCQRCHWRRPRHCRAPRRRCWICWSSCWTCGLSASSSSPCFSNPPESGLWQPSSWARVRKSGLLIGSIFLIFVAALISDVLSVPGVGCFSYDIVLSCLLPKRRERWRKVLKCVWSNWRPALVWRQSQSNTEWRKESSAVICLLIHPYWRKSAKMEPAERFQLSRSSATTSNISQHEEQWTTLMLICHRMKKKCSGRREKNDFATKRALSGEDCGSVISSFLLTHRQRTFFLIEVP